MHAIVSSVISLLLNVVVNVLDTSLDASALELLVQLQPFRRITFLMHRKGCLMNEALTALSKIVMD